MKRKITDVSLRVKVPILFSIVIFFLVGISCFGLYRYYYDLFVETVQESLNSSVVANVNELENLIEAIEKANDVVNDNQKVNQTQFQNNFSNIVKHIVTYVPMQDQSNLRECIEEYQVNVVTFENLYEAVGRKDNVLPYASFLILPEYPIYEFLPTWRRLDNTGITKCGKAVETEWYWDAMAQEGNICWFTNEDVPDRLFMAKQMNYQKITMSGEYERNAIGVIVVGFYIEWIEERIAENKTISDAIFFLLDENENLLYTNQKSDPDAEAFGKECRNAVQKEKSVFRMIDGEQYFIRLDDCGSGLQMLTAVPVYAMRQSTFQMVKIIIITMILTILIGVVLVSVLSNMVLKPLIKLADKMENGIVEMIPEKEGKRDEVSLLYQSYNQMQLKIQSLLKETWERAERQRIAEIQMLQFQINPHFVFNTLGTISSFALLEGHDAIAKQLSRLACIMRYNVRDPEALVSLRDELEIIRQYAELQKMSYEDSVRYQFSVMPECENFKIPKLIIQPLVENAVQHSDRSGGSVCVVKVIVKKTDKSKIEIRVWDNGCGRI